MVLILLHGYNRDEEDIKNGVGKSTILNAFYYAIFGDTTQGLPNKSLIINRQNNKDCKVILKFEDNSSKHGYEEFTIIRGLAPQMLRIYKNGIDKTKSTIPETNKYIKEVLSASEDIFSNCVIMRANNMIPFMNRKKGDKKNFIESMFNLTIFSNMLKMLREDLKGIKHDYDIENNSKQHLLSNIEDYKQKLEDLDKDIEKYNEELENNKANLLNAINAEVKNLNELNSVSYGFDSNKKNELEQSKLTYQSYIKKLNDLRYNFGADVRLKTKLIQQLKESNVCPTCGRTMDENHIHNNENKIQEETNNCNVLNEKISQINAKLDEIETKLTAVEDELKNINEVYNKMIYQSKMIESSERLLRSFRSQYEQLVAKDSKSLRKPFEELLKTNSNELLKKNNIIDSLEKNLGKLNICEYVLSDHGVRAYIINKLLEFFNNSISYYLKAFKSTFDFKFNEFFEEEIKDSNGMICSYNNCSGAESKKIDLAISFAFRDILKLQHGVEYNICFYDEILDSSVDSKSLEIIVDFIAQNAQKNNRAVYIITHKQDIQLPIITETIMLEKVNGFTKRI